MKFDIFLWISPFKVSIFFELSWIIIYNTEKKQTSLKSNNRKQKFSEIYQNNFYFTQIEAMTSYDVWSFFVFLLKTLRPRF